MNLKDWMIYWRNKQYISISDEDLNMPDIREFIKSNNNKVYCLPNVKDCLSRIGIKKDEAERDYNFIEDITFPDDTILVFSTKKETVKTLGAVFRCLDYDDAKPIRATLKLQSDENVICEQIKSHFGKIEIPFDFICGSEPSSDSHKDKKLEEVVNKQSQVISRESQSSNDELESIKKQLTDKINKVQALNQKLTSVEKQLEDMSGKLQSANNELEATKKQLIDKNGEVQALNQALTSVEKQLEDMSGKSPSDKRLPIKVSLFTAIILVAIMIVFVNQLSTEKSSLMETNKNLDADNISIKNELQKYKSENSALKRELKETKKRLDDLKKKDSQSKSTQAVEISGNNRIINANNNTIQSHHNVIKGDYNVIKGDYNDIYGNGNKIYGANNKIHGYNNDILEGADNTVIEGNNNTFKKFIP